MPGDLGGLNWASVSVDPTSSITPEFLIKTDICASELSTEMKSQLLQGVMMYVVNFSNMNKVVQICTDVDDKKCWVSDHILL